VKVGGGLAARALMLAMLRCGRTFATAAADDCFVPPLLIDSALRRAPHFMRGFLALSASTTWSRYAMSS
jgi:hypothetical protein